MPKDTHPLAKINLRGNNKCIIISWIFSPKEFTTVYHKHNLITIGQSFPSYFPLELLNHEFSQWDSQTVLKSHRIHRPRLRLDGRSPRWGNQKTKSHKKEKEVDEAPTPGQKQSKSIGKQVNMIKTAKKWTEWDSNPRHFRDQEIRSCDPMIKVTLTWRHNQLGHLSDWWDCF